MATLDKFLSIKENDEKTKKKESKKKSSKSNKTSESLVSHDHFELTPEFENQLWKVADKLRKKMEVHQYKYVVLGLIFLRALTCRFYERRKEIEEELSNPNSELYTEDPELRKMILEDEDFYLSEGVLYLPKETRWDYFVENVMSPNIGEIIDTAIEILEEKYPDRLKDVIPKIYAQSPLDNHDYSYLINKFSEISFGKEHRVKDVFGRIYEYFLGKFTEVEGKLGGKFYTPRSLTKLIVDVLDVKGGSIFDPACGSGGFFVSALEKLEREGIDINELSIYGQDSDPMAYRLTKMNLIIRGAEGDIRIDDSYHDDKFMDMTFDYVVANPPFNDSEWDANRIKPDDPRLRIGNKKVPVPPNGNANYMWILHFIYHTAPNGKAGFVMANGALSAGNVEGEIRKAIIENDLVYGIVACPPKLFYNVSLPVSLWFIRKEKPDYMKGKVLFINAKNLYKQISRRQNILTEEHIKKIVDKFRMFESGEDEDKINELGFAKVATIDEIAKNGYVLTPGRYVGVKIEDDGIPFEVKMKEYSEELKKLLDEEEKLRNKVKEILDALGF
ncbi:type I restriction enyzme ECOR124/3 I M protein (plasmid) [Methanocaldococcus jannaschii DSM 2661]|uniref:Type I restriction enzyme MjaIX methylase subunit n=1 Tax=Methanocaldococcus jannaschii (strain ATCC 43067 / DSM 2661 / JAL-1 / JCM 10045 / NBRC 100440) TaxID=243232 RepID=T1MH_METJA|nr:type I restriction-modification system subunit M [Methanocaldococcus jannaschii]Q60297.1 RecName: Full=Type I restriction enzyme MjaIX methylase subunit; Short=M protein; AltName: Full=Type I methyltransferase M.MjaIX; Short=M.MjaIX [Methanocaldococcus jannaschii DSM 2661]AAC37111.1 type I restriction enyzme ECOR124/3 I M protein [Methanocaldococcus jannaschii DSM 2661]